MTGSEKAFAAGADVAEFTADGAAPVISAGIHAGFEHAGRDPSPRHRGDQRVRTRWGASSWPSRATCSVASESSRLGFPEIQLGIFPGGGGTQRAGACLIGPAKTKDLVWTGRHVRAEEALAIGLVDRVVAADGDIDTTRSSWRRRWRRARSSPWVSPSAPIRRRARRLALGRPRPRGGRASSTCSPPTTPSVGIRSFLDDGPGKATFTGSPHRALARGASAAHSRRTTPAVGWVGQPPMVERGGGLDAVGVGGGHEPGLDRLVGRRRPTPSRTPRATGTSPPAWRRRTAWWCRRCRRSWCPSARAPRAWRPGASTCGVRMPPFTLPSASSTKGAFVAGGLEAGRLRRRGAVDDPRVRARRSMPAARTSSARC